MLAWYPRISTTLARLLPGTFSTLLSNGSRLFLAHKNIIRFLLTPQKAVDFFSSLSHSPSAWYVRQAYHSVIDPCKVVNLRASSNATYVCFNNIKKVELTIVIELGLWELHPWVDF